jgi:hypothetical protein
VLELGILNLRGEITGEDVRRHMLEHAGSEVQAGAFPSDNVSTMSELERLMILRTLHHTGGNQSLAAKQLGIPRRTFCRKLNEHKITFGRHSAPAKSALTLPMYFRAELDVPVVLRDEDGRCFTADARNLSVGGLGLHNFRPPFEASGELTLHFALPAMGHQIDVKGIVVWSQPNGIAGIRFTEINASTSDLLRDWIASSGQTLREHMETVRELNELPSPADRSSVQALNW